MGHPELVSVWSISPPMRMLTPVHEWGTLGKDYGEQEI
jgi:hypothetical protein